MVVRRKKPTTGKKISAVAEPSNPEPEIERPPEETRPVVTQVVEVVEEIEEVPDTQEKSTESVKDMPQDMDIKQEEATTEHRENEESAEPKEYESEEPEKRKEMVEDLYASRTEPSVMPEISMHKKKSMHPMVVWAAVTIIVALLSGGILFAVTKKMVPSASLFAKPTPTPTPTVAPTPTPTPASVDKTLFKIQVLNGGGTPGAASKMKKALEDKGYKVASTGNTDEYTYDTTEIHGKSTMVDAIANLKADLKEAYSLGTVAADLPASSSADVQVIVGKE